MLPPECSLRTRSRDHMVDNVERGTVCCVKVKKVIVNICIFSFSNKIIVDLFAFSGYTYLLSTLHFIYNEALPSSIFAAKKTDCNECNKNTGSIISKVHKRF